MNEIADETRDSFRLPEEHFQQVNAMASHIHQAPPAAAYGLLQDWDGILFYAYDGRWGSLYWQDEEWQREPEAWTFNLSTDPVKWTQTAIGALMFLRGDVQAAREMVPRQIPHDHVVESRIAS